MDLSLETRQENGRTIIEVGGEIDVYTAPKLRECITGLVDEGHRDTTGGTRVFCASWCGWMTLNPSLPPKSSAPFRVRK